MLEGCGLLFQPVVKVLRVEMLKPIAHVAELVREVGTERFLREMVEDPDLLILLFGDGHETPVLKWNVIKV